MKFDPAQWGAPAVSLIVTITFCVLIFYAAKYGMSDNQALQQLVGALTIAFGNVTGYYLGSSSSSKVKDATISQMAGASPPESAPPKVTP